MFKQKGKLLNQETITHTEAQRITELNEAITRQGDEMIARNIVGITGAYIFNSLTNSYQFQDLLKNSNSKITKP